MAVVLDATSTASTRSASGTTATHANLTVGAGLSNGALIFLAVTTSSSTGLTLTWDVAGANQAMTSIGSLATANSVTYIFGLRNPVAGNKTLTANWTGTGQTTLYGISFSGVNQASDAAAFKNFNSVSATTASPSV